MSDPCPAHFIDFALSMAEVATEITLPYFRTPVAIDDKPDLSPVTIADRSAEAKMREMIRAAYPDHGIVGEEEGPEGNDRRFVWVLDPIDGTRRFISGHPSFGTLVALLEDGVPVLGVINMPALQERWVGARGHPTRHTSGGQTATVQTRPCPQAAQATLYATSPLMFRGAAAKAFARVQDAVKTPLFGTDCYGYGLLASGFSDLVVEADLGHYDYMALVPIVEGAGGIVTDWQGKPLTLGSGDQVMAAGDARCGQEILALLAGS